MSIETSCYGCGKLLRVADEHAGKQARCPACGSVYAVPLGTNSTPSQPELSIATEATQPPRWYMKTPEGQIYGPASRVQLEEWASQGRISGECSVREGENGSWNTAAVLFPAMHAPRTRATAASTGGGYAVRPLPRGDTRLRNTRTGGATNPYAAPQAYASSGPHQPHRGGLILALAILGWFACPILSVVAWAMGSEDLRKMRLGQMDPSGQGLTQAGQILGMIQSILLLVTLAFAFLMCLIGAASQ